MNANKEFRSASFEFSANERMVTGKKFIDNVIVTVPIDVVWHDARVNYVHAFQDTFDVIIGNEWIKCKRGRGVFYPQVVEVLHFPPGRRSRTSSHSNRVFVGSLTSRFLSNVFIIPKRKLCT